MTDNPLERLLGNREPDPGCDAGFEQLDQYCEAVRRGENVSLRFRDLVAHIRNCAACREDTEGMLAALRELEDPWPGR